MALGAKVSFGQRLDSVMSEVFSNFNDSLILQCLSAWGAWSQHLHPLNCHSHYLLPSAVPSQCQGQSFSAGKTCSEGFPSALSPGHAQITPRLAVTDAEGSQPPFCLSELEGPGSDPVQTPGTELALLHLVAGCSLSSWDPTTLLVGNVLIVIGARQICTIWASGSRATYSRGFFLVILLAQCVLGQVR